MSNESEVADCICLHLEPQGRPAATFYCHAFCGEEVAQAVVFEHATPAIDRAVEGGSGTIFCYGASGTGKTHTMMGPPLTPGADPLIARGIMHRAASYLFHRINERAACGETLVAEASFFKICLRDGGQETLVDLFADHRFGDLHLEVPLDSFNPQEILTCEGLCRKLIGSPEEMCNLIDSGHRRRKDVEPSSALRSHCLFVVSVDRRGDLSKATALARPQRGRLVFADLAGSESLRKVDATAPVTAAVAAGLMRMTSGASSRTSKTTPPNSSQNSPRSSPRATPRALSPTPSAVSTSAASTSPPATAGARNGGALAVLLRDCLGGSGFAVLIANIAPEEVSMGDTSATLTFAQQMLKVRCSPQKVVQSGEEADPLMRIRQRHVECVRVLNEKARAASATPRGDDERKLFHRKLEDLNMRIESDAATSSILEDLQQQQAEKIHDLRDEVTHAAATSISSFWESSQQEMSELMQTFEIRRIHGAERFQKLRTDALMARAEAFQSELEDAEAEEKASQELVLRLRSQLEVFEEQSRVCLATRDDFIRHRDEVAQERRSFRQECDERWRNIVSIESDLQRCRTEASVQQAENAYLATQLDADVNEHSRMRESWLGRETHLVSEQQEAQKTLGAQQLHAARPLPESAGFSASSSEAEELHSLLQRLESEEEALSAQLEASTTARESIEDGVRSRKAKELTLRQQIADELSRLGEDLAEARQRETELLAMLRDVQATAVHAASH